MGRQVLHLQVDEERRFVIKQYVDSDVLDLLYPQTTSTAKKPQGQPHFSGTRETSDSSAYNTVVTYVNHNLGPREVSPPVKKPPPVVTALESPSETIRKCIGAERDSVWWYIPLVYACLPAVAGVIWGAIRCWKSC